jgi:hypothetical protein
MKSDRHGKFLVAYPPRIGGELNPRPPPAPRLAGVHRTGLGFGYTDVSGATMYPSVAVSSISPQLISGVGLD